ncbi:unnamed protein product [Symbiodinium microadriaticum]|nr:unnamed protein product [Symbiodinium microadriaticum]
MKLAYILPKVQERDSSSLSKGHAFTPAQISKYKKWFSCLTKNKDKVPIEIIGNTFVSAGILKSKRELVRMFESRGNADTVGFDGFLDVITVNYMSTKLCMQKLDSMIDDAADGLSSETILTQERRRLLLEHVVDRPAVRAWRDGHPSAIINMHRLRRRVRKGIFRAEEAQLRERLEATDVVWELRNVLQNTKKNEEDEKEQNIVANAVVPRPLTAYDVLRPLEELFESSVADAAKVTVQRIETLQQDNMSAQVGNILL